MVKAFYTPSDGRTWYAWGFIDSKDELYYRTGPFRETRDQALIDGTRRAAGAAGQNVRASF